MSLIPVLLYIHDSILQQMIPENIKRSEIHLDWKDRNQ